MLTDALNEPCAPDVPMIERHGCGKVELEFFGGFTNWTSLFDERTGAMIGRTAGSDDPYGACSRFTYEFGEELECTAVRECARCPGTVGPTPAPACSP